MTRHDNRIVLPGDDGLSLTAYTAEPGSRSEEAVKLLGSGRPAERGERRHLAAVRTVAAKGRRRCRSGDGGN